jgi:hypothetical protein
MPTLRPAVHHVQRAVRERQGPGRQLSVLHHRAQRGHSGGARPAPAAARRHLCQRKSCAHQRGVCGACWQHHSRVPAAARAECGSAACCWPRAVGRCCAACSRGLPVADPSPPCLLKLPLHTLPSPCQDIAGLVKGASKGEGLGNQFLANIRECDSIVQVGGQRAGRSPTRLPGCQLPQRSNMPACRQSRTARAHARG